MGKFRTEPVKKSRYAILDHLHVAAQKHHVYGFIEVDVTQAKHKIKNIYEKTGKKLSFTGWLLVCIRGNGIKISPRAFIFQKEEK